MSDTLDPRTDAEKALREAKATLTDLDAHLLECGPLHTAEDAYDTSYRGSVLDALISIDIVLDNLPQTDAVEPLYASPQPANPAQVTDAQIEHMVQQFLRWKLPDDFNPDGGISFTKVSNVATPYEYRHEPVGTNLFDYRQAKEMVLNMLDGLAAIGTGEQAVAVKPLEWEEDHGVAGMGPYRLFKAETPLGRFVYGTDAEGSAYYHTASSGVMLVGDEAKAKQLAEAAWQKTALDEVGKFVDLSALSQPHPSDERVVEALRLAHSFIAREYRDEKSLALEGEFVSKEARPVFRALSDALAAKEGR